MKTIFGRLLTLALAIIFCVPILAWAAQAPRCENSNIARYMKLYGYSLSEAIILQSQEKFTPQKVDVGPVQVCFDEIIYDGQWMYTAASAWPKNPDTVMVLPGSAQLDDPVAGLYSDNSCSDTRTFKTAAKEDNKRLLSVYAYIKEFDDLGVYILDYIQDSKDRSILLSGAQLAGGDNPVEITWSVQLYDVSLTTGQFCFLSEYLFSMTIQPITPYIERRYCATPGIASPFEQVVLVHTPLNTYVMPQWHNDQDHSYFSVSLIDADGLAIAPGAPPTIDSYTLATLPDQITLSVRCWEADNQEQQFLFVAEDSAEHGM